MSQATGQFLDVAMGQATCTSVIQALVLFHF